MVKYKYIAVFCGITISASEELARIDNNESALMGAIIWILALYILYKIGEQADAEI